MTFAFGGIKAASDVHTKESAMTRHHTENTKEIGFSRRGGYPFIRYDFRSGAYVVLTWCLREKFGP